MRGLLAWVQLTDELEVMSSRRPPPTPPALVIGSYNLTRALLLQGTRISQQEVSPARKQLVWRLAGCAGGRRPQQRCRHLQEKTQIKITAQDKEQFFPPRTP